MSFEAEWLHARRPYDDAALAREAIDAIRGWGARLPDGYAPVVVDLGSGTGAALWRVRRWLAPRPIRAFAVDQDAALLGRVAAAAERDGAGLVSVVPILGDLLEPLDRAGGPADGAVDLVVGHALADLLPLDRLARRVAALARPGGLVHLALAYDGLTAFAAAEPAPHGIVAVEQAVLAAFHRHMDRPAVACPAYGGSTSGRRLGPALAAGGLEVLVDRPSVWRMRASDGPHAAPALARLIRFVADAAREDGRVSKDDARRWADWRRAALDAGTLEATVGHRDVLARAPTAAASGR